MTYSMNDLIPLAVIGIGNVEIAFTCDPKGVIVGSPSLLDRYKPIYLTLDLNVWILLIVNNIT